MKKQLKGFLCGFLAAGTLFAMPTIADSVEKSINVLTDYVKVVVDGKDVQVKNFVNEGNTYLGLRDMANVLGFDVEWDEATNTAKISTVRDLKKQVAMVINGQEVSAEKYNMLLINLKNMYAQYGQSIDPTTAKQAIQNELVAQAVILQKAEEYGVGVTEEEKNKAAEQMATYDMFYGGQEAFNAFLAQNGYTREGYEQAIIENAVQQKLFTYLEKNDPDYLAVMGDTQAYYDAHKEDYKTPTVQVKHILIPTIDLTTNQPLSTEEQAAAKEKADQISESLAKGGDFEALLAENKNDAGQPDTGYFVNKDTSFVKEFKEAALAMKKGEITQPVKSSFGYHIIKALDVLEYTPYDEFVKNDVPKLLQALDDKKVDSWVTAAEVVVNDDVVNALYQ